MICIKNFKLINILDNSGISINSSAFDKNTYTGILTTLLALFTPAQS